MPTYDYRCSSCGHEFEKFQPISAAAQKKCPKCRKTALKRLIGTGAGIIFKGGGFYQTDYRSESYKAAAKKEGESAASEKGAEKKSEAGASPEKSSVAEPPQSGRAEASTSKDTSSTSKPKKKSA